MAVEEAKIIDLINSYKKRKEEHLRSWEAVDNARVSIYGTVISDLEELLPRKSIADLDVSNYGELTGTIVEYAGMRGVILGGSESTAVLFTFADVCVVYADPTLVYPLNEDRIWDETGAIL